MSDQTVNDEISEKLQAGHVKVNSYADIVAALKPFMPDSTSELRKSLVEGFDVVKRRKMLNDRTSKLNVDDMYCWVDKMIDTRMNGKRKGMFVIWSLPEGKFRFDPISGALTKED